MSTPFTTPAPFAAPAPRAPVINAWLMALALGIVLLVVLFGGVLMLHQAGVLDRLLGPRSTPTTVSVPAAALTPTTPGLPAASTGPAAGSANGPEQSGGSAAGTGSEGTPAVATVATGSLPSASRDAGAARPESTLPSVPSEPTPGPTALPTATSVPPGDRVVQAQQRAASGDEAGAITQLEAMLLDADVQVDGAVMDDIRETLRKLYVADGNRLLDSSRFDESARRFGQALQMAPNDPSALDGQKRLMLSRRYAQMEASWGQDDEAAISALEAIMQVDAGFRDTREKLYALLIAKADRLIAAGDRGGAFPVLTRAQNVIPGRPEARQRLASYTPTPAPRPTTIGRPV